MKITHIVAMDSQRCIGKGNKLPWHIPADLKYFKDNTLNHVILMGRKTLESLPFKLPKRFTALLSTSPSTNADISCDNLDTLLRLCKEEAIERQQHQLFVVGGASVYRQTLPQADVLLITQIDTVVDGDTFYPEFEHLYKQICATEWFEENGLKFRFTYWIKK